MASLLTIWQQHPEWAARPQQHRASMDEAARNYVLQLQALNDGQTAARIAAADLKEMRDHITATEDFADIDFYDEETATPFEKQVRRMQEAVASIYDSQIRPMQEAMQKTLGIPAPATESPDRRKAKAMREFCGIVTNSLNKYGIVWRQERQGQALQHQRESQSLPDSLNTEIARKVFGKAIANGWMSKTASGYKWRGIDGKASKAQLAYLCGKVYGYQYGNTYSGNVGDRVPYEALQALFSITRLDRALRQANEAKKPQRWRQIIDSLFDTEQAPC